MLIGALLLILIVQVVTPHQVLIARAYPAENRQNSPQISFDPLTMPKPKKQDFSQDPKHVELLIPLIISECRKSLRV